MGAVATKTRADLGHRRLQGAALTLVLFLAAAAATLALNILVASHEPFDRAFAAARGADIAITYAGPVDDAQLAATAHASGVTAAAGPYPIGLAVFDDPKGGLVFGQAISGRAQPDGTIDTPTMIAGRWWQQPGEIVLDQDTADLLMKRVGDTVSVYTPPAGGGGKVGPGQPPGPPPDAVPSGVSTTPALTATVVGIAASVSTPNVAAWLSPSDVALVEADRPIDQEMLYRVDPAATAADLAAAESRITAGVDPQAVAGARTWIELRSSVNSTADLYVPVLLAFAIFALLAAAFSIANVVSGIVLSTYRDIGVMKAIGFTPGQVSGMLLVQVLLPAALGTALGVVAGVIASQPTVARTTQAFGLPATFAVSPVVLIAVPVVALGIAVIAAVGPAIRAGSLSAVEAITRGTMPAVGGSAARLRSLGFRLPVALPMRLGLTAGIAHPGRSAMTLGALVVGVAAVTFALGTNLSLIRIITDLNRYDAAPVGADIGNTTSPDEIASTVATIAAMPETAHVVSVGRASVSVPIAGSVEFVGYDGDATWAGYVLTRGRWFTGPGEVVAPTNVFRETGLHVGDTIDVTGAHETLHLRLVGETFDQGEEGHDGLVLRGTYADLTVLEPSVSVDHLEMQPRSGISAHEYRSDVVAATNAQLPVYSVSELASDASFLLFLSVITFLGMVLVAISIGGVFNTVLLETRQRWRELAILKAIGLTPRQVLVQVVSSVLGVGLAAGVIGVPLGLLMEHVVIDYMGDTAAHLDVPASAFDVLVPMAYVGLALAGLGIAVVGAFLPARRAAWMRVAPVLQAE